MGMCSNLESCSCCGNANTKIIMNGTIVVDHSPGHSGPGNSAAVRMISATQIDDNTGNGITSERAYLEHGKTMIHNGTKTTTYRLKFFLDPSFGIPGAFIIKNNHNHKFFLQSATFKTSDEPIIHFDCRSWIYPVKKTETDRIFFSTKSYLPSQTPPSLKGFRANELESLRDNSTEREEWERNYDYEEWKRIYGYDYYNDLSDPEKGRDHIRPILGGSKLHPYPRRGRTARPYCVEDPLLESRPKIINYNLYTPPDERISPNKMELIQNSIQSTLKFLIPDAKSWKDSKKIQSFDDICNMISSSRSLAVNVDVTEKLKNYLKKGVFKKDIQLSNEDSIKLPLQQVTSDTEYAWRDDEEFGHQMLIGTSSTRIKCLKAQDFPLLSKKGTSSSMKSSDLHMDNLDNLTLDQAISKQKIFILDHHDYLMPFLSRINNSRKGVHAYASRTLFFLRNDATLKPVIIELSLPDSSPGKEINRVFVPAKEGTEAALWKMAKTHVAANDSAHSLISHWLHTHAVVEPFIIATRRQLSAMHPVHRLLDPHFKDTMHINALARSTILNAGGILENILFSGEFSLSLSCELYKEWRFSNQALPADLLKRNMALEDTSSPSGVKILFAEYRYGVDGLEIWEAIKMWVTDFCSVFYIDDDSVTNDEEIQKWWSEIKCTGHGDKYGHDRLPGMQTFLHLTDTLTTLIWITSAFHAWQNFGQYTNDGFPSNRPTLCRKSIPEEGTQEFAEFLRDPDKYYLSMLPERLEVSLGIALMEILSRSVSDELYLGQRPSLNWTDNEDVIEKFEKFKENIQQIVKKISTRNRSKIPYGLLNPDTSKVDSKDGIARKGIPNSISI